jgi:23S rRNA (guanosine2251-2'-O)-methyltransferase
MEKPPVHAIHQCLRPECRLRFPILVTTSIQHVKCPKCGSPTRLIATAELNNTVTANPSSSWQVPLEVLLDNIRSALNVGSIFRSADGAGAQHLYLCGVTPAPGDTQIAKTALGAEFAVPWSSHWNGVEIACALKEQGKKLWALENSAGSQSIFELSCEPAHFPIVLVIGNEVSGIDPGILQQCERSIHIPMLGTKKSLNVATAFGIAVYTLRFITFRREQNTQ